MNLDIGVINQNVVNRFYFLSNPQAILKREVLSNHRNMSTLKNDAFILKLNIIRLFSYYINTVLCTLLFITIDVDLDQL